MIRRVGTSILCCFSLAVGGVAVTGSFVNWESSHVHPLELTPDGGLLLAVNTADARLEILAPHPLGLARRGSVPVGLDPVSVRARTPTEAWVVNAISDSVSIVDLATHHVVRTLPVCDDPADVVFAGVPARAFVSCSSTNRIEVYDAASPAGPIAEVAIAAEEPRALAASPDGARVYAAIFESGNGTTILSGGRLFQFLFPPGSSPPNVVSAASGRTEGPTRRPTGRALSSRRSGRSTCQAARM